MKDDELLDIAFQSLKHPELVYKTAHDLEKAAYSSILAFFLVVVAIQTCQRLDSFQFILLIGPTWFVLFISLIYFARSLTYFMTAEFNRRQNSVLFANSILAKESDNSVANYQMYNIRVLHTHTSGPYLMYASLIILAISLFIIDFITNSSGEPLSGNLMLLFGPIASGISITAVTFVALVLLSIGSLGLGLRIYSDLSISRWNDKSETQIKEEAEKHVAAYGKGVQISFEEAVKTFDDAENGYPAAIAQKNLMVQGMNKELVRLRNLRLIFILAIIIVSIVDFIVLSLP